MVDRIKAKIIEVLRSSYGSSFNAPHFSEHELEPLADHLIANNITIEEWIPVDKDLPTDFRRVLVSVEGRDESLVGRYNDDNEEWLVEVNLSEYRMIPVTHWREMPKPQKGK